MIAELDRYGGDVIYFSGDAVTCWLDGDDGLRAAAAAFAMQKVMDRVGEITTPAGVVVRLALKVAVACGAARRFVVGNPDIQLIDVLAGALIGHLAAAEHHANKGEVVLDESAVTSLRRRVTLGEARPDLDSGRIVRVATALTVAVPDCSPTNPTRFPTGSSGPGCCRRSTSGSAPVAASSSPSCGRPIRCSFASAASTTTTMTRRSQSSTNSSGERQQIMTGYGGNVLQLTLGDKGAYLYGVFGSPVAHEDDAARAGAAALDLRDLERSTDARGIQIGLTHGRLGAARTAMRCGGRSSASATR